MSKRRTIRRNIFSTLHLHLPFLIKFALLLTILDWRNPWFIVLLYVIGLTIAAKQIVPHHFILWALPIALCAQPTALFFVAWLILWFIQDFAIWQNPKLIYPLTFRYRSGSAVKHYGQLLEDADEAIDWVKKNTAEGEEIFVNGYENSFCLDVNRPVTVMQICEAQGQELIPARVIVHCASSAQDFDYSNYEHRLITPHGLYSIMEQKK